eukprot:NODE_11041_length_290_cov_189.331915.p3 GENE.NODE_11041_length_290_cov_189.331915~~NODE_11041_length_290_cov_189.331915.p3  ORF type:complete len:55 (+),score=16.47 NODE_11041_length_290_cov_189.331915:3-167(+)
MGQMALEGEGVETSTRHAASGESLVTLLLDEVRQTYGTSMGAEMDSDDHEVADD